MGASDTSEVQIVIAEQAPGLWVLAWGQDEANNLFDEREFAVLEFLKNKKKFASIATAGQI